MDTQRSSGVVVMAKRPRQAARRTGPRSDVVPIETAPKDKNIEPVHVSSLVDAIINLRQLKCLAGVTESSIAWFHQQYQEQSELVHDLAWRLRNGAEIKIDDNASAAQLTRAKRRMTRNSFQ